MKKTILTIILSILATAAQAQTTWMIIPPQYWGIDQYEWRGIQVMKLRDAPNYPGHIQCMHITRSLHADPDGPAYSVCSSLPPQFRGTH